jgi:hypothetical protein
MFCYEQSGGRSGLFEGIDRLRAAPQSRCKLEQVDVLGTGTLRALPDGE